MTEADLQEFEDLFNDALNLMPEADAIRLSWLFVKVIEVLTKQIPGAKMFVKTSAPGSGNKSGLN